jgi:Zn ribbon nucleic-acid-binding protein
MKELCPICSSENVIVTREQGIRSLKCIKCGYDESDDLETAPSFKSSQKAKAKNNPYKTGGPRRAK